MPSLRERMAPVGRHLRGRARGIALGVALGAAVHALGARPPERNASAFAAWLGAEVSGTVRAADIAWEPQGGALGELVLGRGVWFLAAPADGQPRDLYRAWVRLTPGGQPLSLRRVLAISRTPDADETGLVLRGDRVLYASTARGHIAAVSLLEPAAGGPLARLLARATTGTLTRLARTDLLLDATPSALAVALDERVVRLEPSEREQGASFDLVTRRFAGNASGIAHALSESAGEGSLGLEALALSRATLGPALTALGGRLLYRLAELASVSAGPRAGDASAQPHFSPIASPLLKPPLGTDLRSGAPEPYLSRATLSPDPARPRATLELVSLDLRQLELGYAGGSEWPHPALGALASGRLPADPARYRRVVAVFNAGPEAAYDRYGAMEDGRLLSPPSARRPTIVVTRSARALLADWPPSDEIPAEALHFSQRETALVRARVAVPSGDPSVRRRTALCSMPDGRLLYAYAPATDPATLGAALAGAGCDYALPLAAGPERLGFALADVASSDRGRFELLDGDMDFDGAATLRGSTRDFFYVLVRDMTPAKPDGASWQPDGGTQPAPAWLPGILRSELRFGGITVSLTSFAGGRFDLRVRPGALEPGAKGQAWSGALADEDRARGLAEIELGHATGATRLGLALGALIPLPLRPTSATLVVGNGTARVLLPGEAVTLVAGEHSVQLPLLADDAEVTARARERGDTRSRGALCVSDDGRIIVATLRHDSSDPLAVALRAAGCRRVVELDRGSHHPAWLGRAGTDQPPREKAESSALWLLGRK
jgi:hypothetical protein